MSQNHILFEKHSLGAKSTKDNEHFKDLQNVGFPGQDPKGQKVPSKKIRLSESFGRTCLLRPVILILESPEKCVKQQISVPSPRHLHSVGQCRGQAFARVTRPQMELLLPLLEPHREPRTCFQYSELFTLMESARLTGLNSCFSSPPPFLISDAKCQFLVIIHGRPQSICDQVTGACGLLVLVPKAWPWFSC